MESVAVTERPVPEMIPAVTVFWYSPSALPIAIAGLPTADKDGFINYGMNQSTPFVGLGFIVRYLSGGVTYYTPVILTKAILNPQSTEAATQEDEVDFQTQELEFTLSRDDSSNGVWKKVGGELASEAAAEAAIKGFFNIQ